MGWYYTKDKKRYGPITEAELLALIKVGDLGPRDFVWRPGLDLWSRAGDLAELFPPPPLPGEPPAASPSGATSPRPDLPTTHALMAAKDEHHPETLVQSNGVWSPDSTVCPLVSEDASAVPEDLHPLSLEPSTTPSNPSGSMFHPDTLSTITQHPALVAAAWIIIASAIFRIIFAVMAPASPSALQTAIGGLVWDSLIAIGLLRTRGLFGMTQNTWRILAIIRLGIGALVAYGQDAGAFHHLADLQMLEAAPGILGLLLLLTFRPTSWKLIGLLVSIWATTQVALGLQVAGFRPLLRMVRVAQVRDLALERRTYSDPGSGLQVNLPSGWYLLPLKNPIVPASPAAREIIACPQSQLFGMIGIQFLPGNKMSSGREPVDQYLDDVLANLVRHYPDAKVFKRESLNGSGAPGRQAIVTATDGGREIVTFTAAFDDGYNFHLLSAACPRAEQDRGGEAFKVLEGQFVFTKPTEQRERKWVAEMERDFPLFTHNAAEAMAHYLITHRMRELDAQMLGIECGMRASTYLPTDEARELNAIVVKAILTLPPEELTMVRGISQEYSTRGTVSQAENDKVSAAMNTGIQNLPSALRERYKYLFSKGMILAIADR